MLGPLNVASAAVLAQEALPADLSAWDWIQAGIILVASVALAQVLRRLATHLIHRGEEVSLAGRLVGRLIAYVVVLAGLVYALSSLHVRIGPLLGALGVGGLALALAAQDVLANFIAGILIETRRPFRRGDQISAAGHAGTVEDVNLRTVVLRSFDGERVVIPNSEVIGGPIVNHTARGIRRTTLTVGVAYQTDLERARRVILDAVRGADGVRPSPAAEAWVEEFADSSINFAVRFWHAPDIAALYRVRNAAAIAVKSALDAAGIEIPFPQRTLWWGQAPGGGFEPPGEP